MRIQMMQRVSDALADAQARGWNGPEVLARVAVAAMHEATPEMDAAFVATLDWMSDTPLGRQQREAWRLENRRRWTLMVDAALAGKGAAE